ncbi:MAG TPA: hypothetical protein VIX59_04455 [Candidatus Binataceae bacterium]
MKFRVVAPALLAILLWTIDAHAVSLTLQGNGAGVEMNAAAAVYASDSAGASRLITAVDEPSPDGGVFTEVGVPSMMPDGRVLFGAESKSGSLNPVWAIYIGNADAAPSRRVTTAITVKSQQGDCAPAFRGDPYPVADADGNIAFMSTQIHDRDALFFYSHGNLSCLARAGSQTNEGHEIAVLSFGSPQIGDAGQVVFNAWLNLNVDKKLSADKRAALPQAHRQALLMASATGGISELAVEGELGPNRTRYERPFGLPVALASPLGTMAAFTAKTESGAALFLYSGGSMARILPVGTLTSLGPVSYLSPGRPGLMRDGTTAVLTGCAQIPAIFRLSRQRLDMRIARGQLTPFGTELESLGDPVLTASGAMFVGATDSDNHEKLYMLGGDDSFFEVGGAEMIYRISIVGGIHHHTIFTGTLSANQHGDFSYLGGK